MRSYLAEITGELKAAGRKPDGTPWRIAIEAPREGQRVAQQVLALDGYGHMAGTAAALLGCLQVGLAGLISPLVGVFGGSALSMAGVIIGCALMINLVLATTPAYRRGRRRLGSAPRTDGVGAPDQA